MDIDKDGEVAPELTQGAVEPDQWGCKPIDEVANQPKTPTAKPFTQPKSYLLDACFVRFFFPGKRGEKLPGFSHQGGHPVCQEQEWHGALLWRDPQLQGLSAGRWNLGKP